MDLFLWGGGGRKREKKSYNLKLCLIKIWKFKAIMTQ